MSILTRDRVDEIVAQARSVSFHDRTSEQQAIVALGLALDNAEGQWRRLRDAWLEHGKHCPDVAKSEDVFDRVDRRRGVRR